MAEVHALRAGVLVHRSRGIAIQALDPPPLDRPARRLSARPDRLLDLVEADLADSLAEPDRRQRRERIENVLILLQQVAALADPGHEPPHRQFLDDQPWLNSRTRFMLALARHLLAKTGGGTKPGHDDPLTFAKRFMKGLTETMQTSSTFPENLRSEAMAAVIESLEHL